LTDRASCEAESRGFFWRFSGLHQRPRSPRSRAVRRPLRQPTRPSAPGRARRPVGAGGRC